MGVALENYILAVVTTDLAKVSGTGSLFVVANTEEMQRTSLLLARILGGVVHDLENGVYIIVKH